MSRSSTVIFLVLAAVVASAAVGVPKRNDTVYLVDGGKIDCTVLCSGIEAAVILVDGKQVIIPRKKILRIRRGLPKGEKVYFQTGAGHNGLETINPPPMQVILPEKNGENTEKETNIRQPSTPSQPGTAAQTGSTSHMKATKGKKTAATAKKEKVKREKAQRRESSVTKEKGTKMQGAKSLVEKEIERIRRIRERLERGRKEE